MVPEALVSGLGGWPDSSPHSHMSLASSNSWQRPGWGPCPSPTPVTPSSFSGLTQDLPPLPLTGPWPLRPRGQAPALIRRPQWGRQTGE